MTTPTMLNFTQLYGNGGQEYSPFPVIHIFETSTIHTFTHSGLAFIRALGAGAGGGATLIGGAGGWGQLLKNVSAGDELVCSIGAGGMGAKRGGVAAAIAGGDTAITLRGITYTAAGGMSEDDSTPRLSSSNWDYCLHGREPGQGFVEGVVVGKEAQGWGYRIDGQNDAGIPGASSTSANGLPGGPFAPGGQGGFNGSINYLYKGGGGGIGGGGGGLGGGDTGRTVWGVGGSGGNGLVIVYFWPATNP